MTEIPPCPRCQSPYAYQQNDLLVCAEARTNGNPKELNSRLMPSL
ncbi:hypothetical protein [Mucilaginibacter conchicola]